jgi:AcrR family transcriptional regulator
VPHPRAEPLTRRGRERKGAIVAAAAELVYARGVRATSLDDILAAAGAGKSQLYHYFSTKEDLLAAVLDHQLARVLAEQERFRLDTWSGLRRWFDALLAGQQARAFGGCPLGSLVAELTREDDALRRRAAEVFAAWEERLAQPLQAMKDTGRLRASARPHELAQATLAAIQGGYLMSTAASDSAPMRRALRLAFEHLRRSAPRR